MRNVVEVMKQRRSVRSYDSKLVDEQLKKQILAYANAIVNPFHIPVTFQYLDAKKDGLTCPVVVGTDLYVGGKIKKGKNACVAFGYTFEQFILYVHSLGLGTVWLGGTMNRSAYEKAMYLKADEMMPCATPIGYIASKMSVRESMMRKAVKANERLSFEELFFDGSFETSLNKEKANALLEPLEMVRLAPSAVNKQPWRVLVQGNYVHFYLKRSKGFGHEGSLDMQMIDMGIALCHFELTAKEKGLNVTFIQQAPNVLASDMEYIATYMIDIYKL